MHDISISPSLSLQRVTFLMRWKNTDMYRVVKGISLVSDSEYLTLSPFTTVDELKTKTKLKTPFTINLLMDGRRFVCRSMRQFNQTKVSQTDYFWI